jgi:hypothetical protein
MGLGVGLRLAGLNQFLRAGMSWKEARGRIAGCSGRKQRCWKVFRVAFSRTSRDRYWVRVEVENLRPLVD